LFLVVLALVSGACASSRRSGSDAGARDAKLAELGSVSDLQERFNADVGKVRVILLLSPT
jgi:hypothetical protein